MSSNTPDKKDRTEYLQKYYQENREYLLAKSTLNQRERRRLDKAVLHEHSTRYYREHREQILRKSREAYARKTNKPTTECRASFVGFKTNVTLAFD